MSEQTPETSVSAETLPGDRASAFSLDVEERSIAGAVRDWVTRLRTGDPGALPSVLGLVVLAIIFDQVSDRFLSQYNIGNIPGAGAYIAIIGLGLVFVLLLGEIDLSAGTAGGTCAALAAVAVFNGKLHGAIPNLLWWSLVVGLLVAIGLAVWLKAWSAAVVVAVGFVLVVTNLTQHLFLAMVAAVCIGAAIGVLNGYLVAKVGIPSFVVTLALFLAWQGVLQFALSGQPINTSNYSLWYNLANGNLSVTMSWVFTIVVVGAYLAYTILTSVRAQRRNLAHDSLNLVLLRGGVLAVVAIGLTVFFTQNRGVIASAPRRGIPTPAVIVIVLMILCTFALTKTTWGRHLYATGGNAEAARRAGIDVVHMKVTAFVLCSSFGALGGIMLASSQSSASLDLGSGNVLLFSVAAAVIGGTSLFGGRGKPRDAVIGALVIAIIPNGLSLKPSINPQWQSVITGVVLLVAAAIDAVSRRRASRS
ncbi:MAG TPA: ABC transporter permease [Nocardioides sp.]|jgi:D-xylose transport system permease protein|nr:ABC transporter permease [Nocardioides sp.]